MGLFTLILALGLIIVAIIVAVMWKKESTAESDISYDKIRNTVTKSDDDLLNLITEDEEEDE